MTSIASLSSQWFSGGLERQTPRVLAEHLPSLFDFRLDKKAVEFKKSFGCVLAEKTPHFRRASKELRHLKDRLLRKAFGGRKGGEQTPVVVFLVFVPNFDLPRIAFRMPVETQKPHARLRL